MQIDPQKIYAVLTGDIIGSSKLDKELRERLLPIMKQGGEMLLAEYPEAVRFPSIFTPATRGRCWSSSREWRFGRRSFVARSDPNCATTTFRL